ncbi:MAG TPA: NADH-quinone oxidoreductase subunit L, partial [bacterium]
GAAAALFWTAAARLALAPPPSGAVTVPLGRWLEAGGIDVTFALRLDALSAAMGLVVTGVGFLIHLYAVALMRGEEGLRRFYAAMNLFVAAMLLLALADDYLVLYLGWEGVGLCSYLLIGFWHRDPANGRAARKAFVVTRAGDAALLLGLLLIFSRLGTLRIDEVAARAGAAWQPGSAVAIAAAALLLAGALGKSAQLPLQTWLPDAMAGPVPVSALIHAATMVTAGVYLVARSRALFALAPAVLHAAAAIGAATLLLAACSALVQRDVKRALAYSTMSQIGYLYLALGVGAPAAAIFHLVTHAFFKALLFLGAGVAIVAAGGTHDLAAMGGLRRRLPLVFWCFGAGTASLAALPFVTAGFWSKEGILAAAWSSPWAGGWLWAAGVAGALLTALYAFRILALVFFGEPRAAFNGADAQSVATGPAMTIPLVVLALASIGGALLALPPPGATGSAFVTFLAPVLGGESGGAAEVSPLLRPVAVLASLGGAWLAYLFFRPGRAGAATTGAPAAAGPLHRLLVAGWGFDWLYERLFVRPLLWAADAGRDDPADLPFRGLAWYVLLADGMLSRAQSGRMRWYAAGIALGAAAALALVLLA